MNMMKDFFSGLPNSNIQMEAFDFCEVTKYDEQIFSLIQIILNKIEVKFIRIDLNYDVTNETQPEICLEISKQMFELDIGVNEEVEVRVESYSNTMLLHAKLKRGQE